jgi:hypothetical protein
MLSTLKDSLSSKLSNWAKTSALLRGIQTQEARDIQMALQKHALHTTMLYVEEHMLQATSVADPLAVLDLALSQVTLPGLYLEFGVAGAYTINYMAQKVGSQQVFHGFDSFEGLPEFWVELMDCRYDQGVFDRQAKLPSVQNNVKLYPGWFDQTLPGFVKTVSGDIAFVHIDCDLYSSTKTVFDWLGDRIKPGTVIAFNEYFNYPGWQHHEYKAFQEFVAERHLRYEYVGYDRLGLEVVVKILAADPA